MLGRRLMPAGLRIWAGYDIDREIAARSGPSQKGSKGSFVRGIRVFAKTPCLTHAGTKCDSFYVINSSQAPGGRYSLR
jgi:hypothetical protein